MKIYNYIDTELTDDEIETLENTFDLLTEKGKTFVGAVLVGSNTAVLIDMNKCPTVDKMKEKAIEHIHENLMNMPDFGETCFPEKRLAYVTMNFGNILTFIPYEDEYETMSDMPLGPGLYGREVIIRECHEGPIKAAAWCDENKIISDEKNLKTID